MDIVEDLRSMTFCNSEKFFEKCANEIERLRGVVALAEYVLVTRSKEAKAEMSLQVAEDNFSDKQKEHDAFNEAMFEASRAERALLHAIRALAAERERCARVCESRRRTVSNGNGLSMLSHDPASVEAGYCADAIRELGDE